MFIKHSHSIKREHKEEEEKRGQQGILINIATTYSIMEGID